METVKMSIYILGVLKPYELRIRRERKGTFSAMAYDGETLLCAHHGLPGDSVLLCVRGLAELVATHEESKS